MDYIRAIATIFVLIQHASWKYCFATPLSGPWLVSLGIQAVVRIGLPIFFILSGYLLIKPYPTAASYLTFYKKRLARVLPLAVLWSYVYFVYKQGTLDPIWFLREFIQGPTAYHLWFIYCIIGLYIITPFISNIITTAKTEHLLALLFASFIAYTVKPILQAIGVNGILINTFYFQFTMYFIAGYAIRRILDEHRYSNYNMPMLLACMTGMTFLLSFFTPGPVSPVSTKVAFQAYDQSIFLFVACLAFFIMVMRWNLPNNMPIRFISDRSFGIYLSHPMFIWIYGKILSPHNPYVDMFACIVFTLSCAITLEIMLSWAKRTFRERWRNRRDRPLLYSRFFAAR